jgi:hypothetical protein
MSSISIIIIEKGGNIKELKIKNLNEDELYKKCGFKSPTDFKLHTVWKNININNTIYNIHVYGKLVGRANQENKYEFPPPIDNELFFGSCALVNKVDNIPKNLTSGEWNRIYEHLYGGFEDIGDEDSDESEDEDENLPKTKSGYVKDDFIVDDDYDDDDESYESEISIPKSKKRSISSKTPRRNKAPTVFNISNIENSEYTDELEEEEYI